MGSLIYVWGLGWLLDGPILILTQLYRQTEAYITKTMGALYEFMAFLYKQSKYASYSRIT